MRKISSENRNAFMAGIFSFFIYLLRICQRIDINISLDEIGTLSSAVALAGLDWSGVLPYTRYYGYGFYWIYMILFRITDNPYIIYIMIYLINCFVLSTTAFLIYKIEINELELPDNLTTLLFAVLPGAVYSIVNYSYLSNDLAVYTGFWLVAFFLFKLMGNTEKRGLYSTGLAFCISYLLTVHEKTVAVFGITVSFLIIWKILLKKDVVNWRKFAGCLLIFYACARISKKFVIAAFWSNIKAERLANTSVIYTDVFWFTGSLQKFKILVDIFLSNIIKMSISTYGLYFLGLSVCCSSLIILLKRKLNIKEAFQSDPVLEKIVAAIGISMAVICITMAGLALQWGNSAWNRVNTGMELGKSIRAYRYLRYYIVYAGPLFISLYKLCLNKKIQKKEFVCTGIAFGALICCFLFFIDNYLGEENLVMTFTSFLNDSVYDRYISILILIVCIFLLYRFSDIKRQLAFCAICCLAILNLFKPSDISFPELTCSRCGATYKYFRSSDKSIDLNGNIYVLGSENIGCYQFFLNRYVLQLYEGEREGIVLSNYGLEDLENVNTDIDMKFLKDGRCVQLDENEYIFIL